MSTAEETRWARAPRTEKVSDAVAREIAIDIVRTNLGAGAKLPSEAVMLEQFGVGRSSLREALRILEVFGLIEIKPGRGGGPVVADVDARDFGKMATFYYHLSRSTYRELVEARQILEPFLAGLAATRKSPDVVRQLEKAVAMTEAALDAEDDMTYLDGTSQFHEVVSGVSGNGVLDIIGRSLKHAYADRVIGLVSSPELRQEVAKEHREIADAIISGDAKKAEELMRRHMESYSSQVAERYPGLLDEMVRWHSSSFDS